MTLLELIVVMAMIAILLGVGVGAITSLDLGKTTAVSQIKNTVRATRTFSIAESVPSLVVLDATSEEQRVFGVGLKTVGQWHFEDETTTGAFGRDGVLSGADLDPNGKIGHCVRLGEQSTVLCGTAPVFDPVDGIGIEAWVRPDSTSGGRIVEKGQAYALELGPDGELVGRVNLVQQRRRGKVISTRRLEVVSEEPVVAPGRWTHVSMIYDRFRLRLFVDGREVGTVAEQEGLQMAPDPEAPLTIGSPAGSLIGRIDEVRIALAVRGDEAPLPESVTLLGPDRQVHFDGRGNLDPEFHTAAVNIELKLKNGSMRRLRIGWLGTIEEVASEAKDKKRAQ